METLVIKIWLGAGDLRVESTVVRSFCNLPKMSGPDGRSRQAIMTRGSCHAVVFN